MKELNLDISKDVLFGIAQLALDKVEGIRPNTPPVGMGEILTGRRAKGISVEQTDGEVNITLSVRVQYGKIIPELAKAAQKAIRESISSMTGLKVNTVNVTVVAIDLPEELAISG